MAQRRYFRVEDLSGGLNLDANEILIADNEATRIENFRLDKLGSLVSRWGYQRYNSELNGTALAIGRWRDPEDPSNNSVLVAVSDGTLIGNSSGEWTQLASTLVTGTEGEFVPIQDMAVLVNGVDTPVSYNGSVVNRLGIAAPSVEPGLAATTGSLSGTYQYAYTYYDSVTDTESNPSDTAPITLTAQGTTVSVVGSGIARVDTIRIYRTNAGGSTLLLLDTVSDATQNYDDDGSVTLSIVTPETNNDEPLAYEHLAYFKGYTFGSIGNTLYWSKPFDPDAWPILNSTEVPFEGNDTIVALWSYEDTLLIFGRTNIILLAGSGGAWNLSRMDVQLGVVSDRAITEVDGALIFLSHSGLRVFPSMQPFAPKLTRTLSAFTPDELAAAAMTYVPQERSVWVSVGGNTYIFHTPNQAVSLYTFGTAQFLTGGESGFDEPIFIDAELNFLNQYGESASQDIGENIRVVWQSKVFQLDDPELTKFFRRIGAFASTGSSTTITITISDRSVSSTIALSSVDASNVTLWDQFNWDQAPWSSEGVSYFIAALPADTLFGRTAQISITGDVSGQTEVTSPLTFEYRTSNRFTGP